MADPHSRAKAGPDIARYAVLDIGSNSVRLVIYDIFGSAFTPIYNEKVLAGLGRDLAATGRLSASGKTQTLAALKRFKMITDAQDVDRLIIGATAALRDASDAQAFLKTVARETGLTITPISGDEEARLSAMGLLAAMPRAQGLAADLGGASLELIQVGGGQAGRAVSLPIGPFQMLGKDLATADYDKALLSRLSDIVKTRGLPHVTDPMDTEGARPTLYLIGGAWRNLAAIHQERTDYPLQTLQSYVLETGTALDLARWAMGEGKARVLTWPDMNQRRAETLPYAAALLQVLIQTVDPARVIISATGLREGLIYDAIPPAQRARDALHDGCRDLARGNLSRRDFADPLYDFLAPLAPHLPPNFTPDIEARLRYSACLLAGIGKGLHPTYRASLVFDHILYAPIAGLTHEMRAYLALILFRSFTSDTQTPNDTAIKRLLSAEGRRAANIYGLAIRLAVVASGRSPVLLSHFTPSFSAGRVSLDVAPEAKALLTGRVTHRLSKLNAGLKSKS